MTEYDCDRKMEFKADAREERREVEYKTCSLCNIDYDNDGNAVNPYDEDNSYFHKGEFVCWCCKEGSE